MERLAFPPGSLKSARETEDGGAEIWDKREKGSGQPLEPPDPAMPEAALTFLIIQFDNFHVGLG